MKIEINKIPFEGGVEFNEVRPAQEFDLNNEEVEFIAPLRIDIYAQRGYNNINLKVSLNSKVKIICARCLKDFVVDINKEFPLYYSLLKNETTVNPDVDIREELMVNYPLKPLCKEACLGICQACGQDLNTGPCKCKK